MNPSVSSIASSFYLAASPIFILSVAAILAMLQAVFPRVNKPNLVFATTLMGLLLAFLGSFYVGRPGSAGSYLAGSYLSESLARYGQILILGIALVVALLVRGTQTWQTFMRGEVISLFLMIVTGMLVLVSSDDLITLFVGLELSSIGLYALVGYITPSQRSQEGAIKYFVLGSFAAAFLLFGFALLYAGTGSLRISTIVAALPRLTRHPWVLVGGIFTLVGLGFKFALAPFSLWAPDAYEAAPTGVTAFMATAVKVMILIATVRFLAAGLASLYAVWLPTLLFLAILSMIFGNLLALVQTSLKRMLAYSSIAHAGYMAVALCAISGASAAFPIEAVLFYLIAYSIMSVGAFGILMWFEGKTTDNLHLDDLTGLGRQYPAASFALAAFMFSFAGMPPTVGFIAKFFIFNAALVNGLYSLVIIGVIGSTISLYYYLRVIVKLYMSKASGANDGAIAPIRSWTIGALTGAALIATILLGTVAPGPTMRALRSASSSVVAKTEQAKAPVALK